VDFNSINPHVAAAAAAAGQADTKPMLYAFGCERSH